MTYPLIISGTYFGDTPYLVSVDTISGSTPEDVTLSFTLNDLSLMETFETINYKSMAEPTTESLDSSVFIWPFLPPADDSPMYEVKAQVPPQDLVIRRGAQVEATDGKIDKVDGFMVNPENSRIAQLVLEKGNFWENHDVAIPIDSADAYDGQVVTLKLDQKGQNALPRLKVKRL